MHGLATAWLAAAAAAVIMIRIGVLKRRLVERHSLGPCPSCGRNRSGRVCTYCTRR